MYSNIFHRSFLVAIIMGAHIIVANAQPAAYSGNSQVSYVRTWVATGPESSSDGIVSRPLKDAKLTTQYLDGLGRGLQTVTRQGSYETGGTAKDLVAAAIYDQYGREQYKYLPFGSSASDGAFKYDPFQQQATFMSSQYGSQGESYYYTMNSFEYSPLNRVTLAMPAGDNWVGSSRGVGFKYCFNTVLDSIRVWTVTDNGTVGNWGTYDTAGWYCAGLLSKLITTDENGKQVVEFKDKEGKVIMKKVQLTGTMDYGSGAGYYGWLCTYYIYDKLGNLRCVIQPRGVEILVASNWGLTQGLLDEQCFRYEYDQRNRMIVKKVPGADPVQMVYDAKDRLVMTQDGNMAVNGTWLVTKYDALNRTVETGLWNNSSSGNTHRASAYSSSSYPTTSGTYELLTVIHYDNYTSLPSGLSSTFNTQWNGYFSSTDNNNWPYPQMPAASSSTIGLVTWTQTKIIGSSPAAFISSVNLYDDKGRVVQVQTVNLTGGTDVITTQYSWGGQPLLVVEKVQKSGTNSQTIVTLTRYSYDDLNRLVKVEKKISHSQINDGSMQEDWKNIATQEYDKLGQLKKKKLSPDFNSSAGLETMNYEYNIRGWLLGVNRSYVGTTGQSGTSRFGFDLGYDRQNNSSGRYYGAPQYNGNITGMVWKSDGDDVRRKYDFTYDAANRLLKGLFEQDNSTATWNSTNINYKMQMGDGADPNSAYDANGNIKAMSQWGWKLGGSVQIDNLTYNYYNNSNKLLNVIDGSNDPTTKLGDFRTSSLHPQYSSKNSSTTDYSYDANGNLKKDLNKDIGLDTINGIEYNYLNLPQTITVRTTGGAVKGTISYVYDAGGNKLKKIVTEGSTTTNTLYQGGAVFQNDTMQFIAHEEGRIRFKPAAGAAAASLEYDYMVKDHLGNIRMLLTEEQKMDQYPAATMETANATIEESFYNYLPETRVDPPGNYPSNTPPGNAKVSVLRGNNISGPTHYEIGPGILLRVMAGDQVNIVANSWWSDKNSPLSSSNPLGLNQLLAAISGSSVIAQQHINAGDLQYSTELGNSVGNYLSGQSYNSGRPKAFLCWLALDDQFNLVSGSSGCDQVGTSGTYTTHTHNGVTMNKNGYVYIYVSNETPNIDVYFDNLQVTHIRGSLLEENHYYPFGLTMEGISSKALAFGSPENKRKFNGIEQNTDFDLNVYEAFYRSLDPQTGRFWEIDPRPNEMYSSYSAMQVNPISYFDPFGDTAVIDKSSLTTEYQQNGKGITGCQLGQQMVDEWAAASGLKLNLNNETGMITETGVATNKGYSRTARRQVRKMLGKGGMVSIGFVQKGDSEAEVGGKTITLGVDQIQKDINGTPSSLVSNTMGYGMTAFHEWFHTKAGGSFEHSSGTYLGGSYAERLDKPDVEVNKIRAELSAATGLNYGQRGAYTGVWWWDKNGQNGNTYSPMALLSQTQWNQMQQAMRSKDVSLLPQVPFIVTPLPNLPQ